MPNSGMLDHAGYKSYMKIMNKSKPQGMWLPSRPHSTFGYETPRVSETFSRYQRSIYSARNPPPSATRYRTPLVTRQDSPGHDVIQQMKSNSYSPFYTLSKITCGSFYNRDTKHAYRDFGITPADLMKWR